VLKVPGQRLISLCMLFAISQLLPSQKFAYLGDTRFHFVLRGNQPTIRTLLSGVSEIALISDVNSFRQIKTCVTKESEQQRKPFSEVSIFKVAYLNEVSHH